MKIKSEDEHVFLDIDFNTNTKEVIETKILRFFYDYLTVKQVGRNTFVIPDKVSIEN